MEEIREVLPIQKYRYQNFQSDSVSKKSIALTVKCPKNIETKKLMLALNELVQQQPMLRAACKINEQEEQLIEKKFFPYIEVIKIEGTVAHVDINPYLDSELQVDGTSLSPQFNFKILECTDNNLLLLKFTCLIIDEAHINKLLAQLSTIYSNISCAITLKSDTYNLEQLLKTTSHQNINAIRKSVHWQVSEVENEHFMYMPLKSYIKGIKTVSKRCRVEQMSHARMLVSIYLANYFMSNNDNITLGVLHSSATTNEQTNYIYPDMKMYPLNLHVDIHTPLYQLCHECETMLEAMSNNTTAIFEKHDLAQNMHFETSIYCSDIIESIDIDGESCKVESVYGNDSEQDIAFYLNQNRLELSYNANSYDELTIQTYFDLVQSLYMQMTEDDSQTLQHMNLLLDQEAKLCIDKMNETKKVEESCVISESFEKMVNIHANDVALVFENEALTYDVLNQRVNQVAHYLRSLDIQPNEHVCILAERSIEMVIAILGTIKAGAAYVAIDPQAPQSRVKYIVDDAKSRIILLHNVAYNHPGPTKNISEIVCSNTSNPTIINHLDDTVNVIYTSGTTGKPKGTLIRNRSIERLVINSKYVPLNSDTVILLSGTIAFDATTFEIFGALLNGGTLVITQQSTLLDPNELEKAIINHGVNTMWLTSSLFNQVVSEKIEALESLKYLLIGGEALSTKWVNLLNSREKHPQIINGYGPTESTTFTTTFVIRDLYESHIPIGQPINQTQVYVMQGDQQCGFGVPGELYIAGDGLAKGYLNQPEQTQNKFIDNPFGEGKLYKSGDLVRLRPDGNLDYIGRKDKQVKIRGFRIELTEIEKLLEKIDGINKAVVVVKTRYKDKQIVAYYEGVNVMSHSILHQHLAEELPQYMIPNFFKKIEKIPTTINGKINEAALPEIDVDIAANYKAPKNENEAYLCDLFEEVLHVEKVGVSDNFFELGGHSLRATLVVNRIVERFSKRLTISEFMQAPTVEKLNNLLENKNQTEVEHLPKTSKQTYYTVSPVQRSMYLLWKLNPLDTVYNIPFLWRLSSRLNVSQLEQAVEELIERHEILRTKFIIKNNMLYQQIDETPCIDFSTEITSLTDEQSIIRHFTMPFDLEKGNLIRVRYIMATDQDYLFIDTHHSINDGMSNTILLKELNHLYQNKPLPKLEQQYKNYSEWMTQRDLSAQQKYWHERFEDGIPIMNFPTDYARPSTKQTAGDMIKYKFDAALSSAIKKYVQQHSVTDFMFFMSSVMLLLSKYTQTEDIVVGSVISARTHRDTENMLGMFANTLVYRGFPNKNKQWSSFLNEIKQTCLEAYEHQDYPFERLVDELVKIRDASRNPFFDVMFVLQNNETNHAHFGHSKLTHIMPKSDTAKFDLSFIIEEVNEEYILNLEYSTSLFTCETVEIMAKQLNNIMKALVTTEDKKIAHLSTASEHMEQWIAHHVNNKQESYPQVNNIAEMFEQQVSIKPNHVALIFKDETLTYVQLNQRVNAIIHRLIKNGVQGGHTVGLAMNRGFTMIASMLAVAKIGGTYVPIDPDYPKARINYILNDANVTVVLTESNIISTHKPIIDLTEIQATSQQYNSVAVSAQQPLYVIYTSGTTGHPKGVIIDHGNVHNLVFSWSEVLNLTENEVFLQYANYVFDASVWEIYTALLMGHTLVIASESERLDVHELEDLINRQHIGVASIPVQVCNMMSNYHLKRLVTGGSVSTKVFVEKVKQHSDVYINAYGPSESTVITTYWSTSDHNDYGIDTVPIGKPLTNIQTYIMSDNQLCDINIPGELCITGAQLSKGYLNQPGMNKQSFAPNPFGEEYLYHTGDLARYLPDGNIEFLGRMDNQVKLHGYRIELTEIENLINNHSSVKDSVVVVGSNEERKFLIGYYVSDVDQEKEIIDLLSEQLPQYMIPNHFIRLESIPLNKNGKIEYKQLPLIVEKTHEYIAPRNEEERLFANVVSKVLKIKNVSIDDDFFELGGSSIDAMAVVAHMQKSHITLSMQAIYQHKTIRQILNATSEINVQVPEHLNDLNRLLKVNDKPVYQPVVKNKLGNVFLTGATGFLGAYLLDVLQHHTDQIICCVRANNEVTAVEKLKDNLACYFDDEKIAKILSKVVIHVGNFEDQLRLSQHNIQTIIHAGARTDHFGDEEAFYRTNVGSTKRLLEIAQHANMKFIYISTISVGSMFPETHTDNHFSECDLYKGQSIDSPYTLSKFYGEVAVLECIRLGLDAKIIRVGNLTPSTQGIINMKHVTTNRFSIIMKDLLALDEIGETIAQMNVECSNVDTVAEAIVNIAMLNSDRNMFHVYNPYMLSIQTLLNQCRTSGNPISVIDDQAFQELLNKQNMFEIVGLNSTRKAQRQAQLTSVQTEDILHKIGVEWKPLNQSWIQSWRSFIENSFNEEGIK